MPCYKPLKAWRSRKTGSSGKLGVTFTASQAYVDMPLELPCGQCIGCRLERSRQWAMRCVHESQMWQDNCFVTLTYDDRHLPAGRSLQYRDFQLFMYRLRKHHGPNRRFYMCGEYGETYGRPHYHACFFNLMFDDLELFKGSGANALFVSEELQRLWPHGYCTIGHVTFDSAAYVARYVLKKITGDAAVEHYRWIDPETGEIFDRRPEFTNMSRRPGIGKAWYDKFKSDAYPSDFVIMKGQKVQPPKYYDRFYELEYPSDFKQIRLKRKERARARAEESTPERRKVREKVAKAKMELKRRDFE